MVINNGFLLNYGLINVGGSYQGNWFIDLPYAYTYAYVVVLGDVNSNGGTNSFVYGTNMGSFNIGITSYLSAGYVNWVYWVSVGR